MIIAVCAVVAAAAGAGIGAVLHRQGQTFTQAAFPTPGSRPGGQAHPPSSGFPPGLAPAPSPAPSPSAPSGPSPAPLPPVSPPPSQQPPGSQPPGGQSPGTISVGLSPAAAADPRASQVADLVTAYFTAVNDHDFAAYFSLLSPSARLVVSPPQFHSDFGSTADSAAVLRRISGGPGAVATVTFVSHQSPADSPAGAACTTWRIRLFLAPSHDRFLINPTPPGYRPAFRACA